MNGMGYQTRMFGVQSTARLRAKHPQVRLSRCNSTPPGCGNSISFALVNRDEYIDSQMALIHGGGRSGGDERQDFVPAAQGSQSYPIPHFPCVTSGKPGEFFRNRPTRPITTLGLWAPYQPLCRQARILSRGWPTAELRYRGAEWGEAPRSDAKEGHHDSSVGPQQLSCQRTRRCPTVAAAPSTSRPCATNVCAC